MSYIPRSRDLRLLRFVDCHMMAYMAVAVSALLAVIE